MKKKIIIGTRGSQLALWQAYFTRNQLQELGHEVELKIIKTKGDKIQHLSFDKIEGKGFFTKEIESELLAGTIDLAVHSYKDLPTENPKGLVITANSYRANPYDCLVIHSDAFRSYQPFQLKKNAIVGTSSARRKAQLLAQRPDFQIRDIRGNVPTRIKKIEGEYDAIVLAAAGLERLELDLGTYHKITFSTQQMIPAASQGVLAFQTRELDAEIRAILQHIHDPKVEKAIGVERSILNQLGGGCHQPIGVYCDYSSENKGYKAWASVAKNWNDFPKRIFIEGKNQANIIAEVMEGLRDKTPKSVFISRDLEEDSYFAKAMSSNGYEVHAKSLISFNWLDFDTDVEGDWLFFSSRNGVRFFFEQNPMLPERFRVAALGEGTASELRERGFESSFIGEGSDTAAIAEEFGEWVMERNKGSRVVFPIAKKSLRGIQKVLEKNFKGKIEVQDLVVYSNRVKSNFKIPSCNILVFTSPLNVKTYCKKYAIEAHQTVVSIGKTTGKALEEVGCKNYRLASNPSEIALADCCW
ncbi:MAG: hydroxymethylbilane synthase [Chitinophagales bacterium]